MTNCRQNETNLLVTTVRNTYLHVGVMYYCSILFKTLFKFNKNWYSIVIWLSVKLFCKSLISSLAWYPARSRSLNIRHITFMIRNGMPTLSLVALLIKRRRYCLRRVTSITQALISYSDSELVIGGGVPRHERARRRVRGCEYAGRSTQCYNYAELCRAVPIFSRRCHRSRKVAEPKPHCFVLRQRILCLEVRWIEFVPHYCCGNLLRAWYNTYCQLVYYIVWFKLRNE